MEKMINVTSDNYFYRAYETIAYDKKTPKKPFVGTELIKKKGKLMARDFHLTADELGSNLKHVPGLFFSLPKEVFENYFIAKQEGDLLTGDKTDLEKFLECVKEGMLDAVDKAESSLDKMDKDVEEFQEKILEKVDFEKENLKERISAKQKIKGMSLNA